MNKLANEIKNILEQKRDVFNRAEKLQLDLWSGIKPDYQPLLLSCPLDTAQRDRYPSYNTKEIHFDSEKMLLSGLKDTLRVYNGGCEAVPSVRANMGCGIFPTLFGLKQTLFDDKMPWILEHLSKETITSMKVEDIVLSEEFKTGLEHMAYMADFLSGSPCRIFPMDLQGPCDTAHLVYGDQFFYDLYDDPEFIHHLLELCTQAIIKGMEECIKVIPGSKDMLAHYNRVVIPRSRGGIKISEDTSTLLSKNHIEEFVVPYTRKILEHFGGGYIHYCGKNPNLFDAYMNEPLAYGINFGNPNMHDMEDILKRCAQAGKIYYGRLGNKAEDESYTDYFKKYLKAAQKDDFNILLLNYSCDLSIRSEVVDAWHRAQEEN